MYNEFLIFVQNKGFVCDQFCNCTLVIENALTWESELMANIWADSMLSERFIIVQNKSED